MQQNFPYRLKFYLHLRVVYSKEKTKKFFIKNETEIHQIF